MAVVECVERTADAVKDALDTIKSKPHRHQVIMGVGSGIIAALLLGGSMIALQCAVQQDFLKINWKKVGDSTKKIQPCNPAALNRVLRIIEENRVFFGSFGGGFLVSVSFS